MNTIEELKNFKIKIKNFLCFGDEETGFDQIKRINIIIGRNNSGKSSILQAIQNICVNQIDISKLGYKGATPKIILESLITYEDIRKVFRESTSGGTIQGNHLQYGKNWLNGKIRYSVDYQTNKIEFLETEPPFVSNLGVNYNAEFKTSFGDTLANVIHSKSYFRQKTFKRIYSERNIIPEIENDLLINSDGTGITNNIQKYLNYANWPSELVENTLLKELNKIFEPDISFTAIDIQKDNTTGKWEIYLTEEKKGKIALSLSGSGIKTVIIVLSYLYLVPVMEKKDVKDYVFGFEELENNLHPAIQRKLYTYLRNFALEKECLFFLTTHSSVVIDTFSKDKEAQIIHITHDGEKARVMCTKTYIEHNNILDDLDVRASDLLQANCIVWLEGPSDRLYFNRWIDLWTNGELIEGSHYQCVFYGGRLLAHLSSESPDLRVDDLVSLLRVNRNVVLLIDSDKKNNDDNINATKQRIIKEINEVDGISWLTEGKEIENYLPIEVFQKHYSTVKNLQFRQYQEISSYVDKLNKGDGKKFLANKFLYAERFCKYLTKENISGVLDLEHKLELVCNKIKKWNGIST